MFFSEYKIQCLTGKKTDSYGAVYCLYIPYWTKVSRTDFKAAVLNLYHQRFSFTKMRKRKITTDNSVNNIHSANTTAIETSHDTKPKTRKKKFSNNLSQ